MCWGDGYAGKLGDGDDLSHMVPVAVRGLSIQEIGEKPIAPGARAA